MLPDTIAFPYDIQAQLREFFAGKKFSQVALLVDENTAKYCVPLIRDGLPEGTRMIQVPSGEQYKNLETCSTIWRGLTDLGMDRRSLLIILGGGVLGDMGGFCAATYKRGIDFLLLPTTLLSQVDSSIGGKLGIDFQHFKNHIGVFQEPVGTFIYAPFLKTLPTGELKSGFAEVIKHCLISDLAMWEKVRSQPMERQSWDVLVNHSVEFKHSVTLKDPRETGLRKILNFGHTIGHAVEGYFLQTGHPIYHGEAVALGMITEAWIGFRKGHLSQAECDQISQYLIGVYGKKTLPADREDLIGRMKQDKKNQGKRILMAIPERIGKAIWDVEVSEGEIVESLDVYGALQT